DFVARIFAERVRAVVQPEETGDGKPAAVALQRFLTLAAPLANFVLISGGGEQRRTGQSGQHNTPVHQYSPVPSMSCSSIPANSSLLRSTRSLSWLRSRSSVRNRSARCRQANTAIRVESAFGALAAIDNIRSLTLAATSSTSRESPVVSR